VVQLRRDNALGALYNIVGFQMVRRAKVFAMIPACDASFARLGIHPGLPSSTPPTLLDDQMR
jgi:methylenetetrahydrofolate--tRNA-(uracil-5-)-methyltransferase